jgi:hypothetical protein
LRGAAATCYDAGTTPAAEAVMQRDREPESSLLPPPAVMRSALGLIIPFAIVWAVCGSVLWEVILNNYGTSLPPWVQSPGLALGLMVAYALFGALFGVVLRVFAWLVAERRPRRLPVREARARKDIRVTQDWQEL